MKNLIGFQNGLEMTMGLVTQVLVGAEIFWWPSTKKFFRQEHILPDLFPR
jgi:hypothetical protein